MLTEKNIKLVAMILVLAGALNWGAIALAKTNVVEKLVGAKNSNIVYIVVAAAAIYIALQKETFA
jgi:uncharacterized membrane protein YuzA (DUF378 family)